MFNYTIRVKVNVLHKLQQHRNMVVLGAVCVVSSFAIGLQTVGNVQPFELIEAGSTRMQGDMDGDGVLTSTDVRLMLEIAEGYAEPTPEQLAADPTQDGEITAADAMRILSEL